MPHSVDGQKAFDQRIPPGAGDSAKLIEAHKALRDIADVMMPAFRAGAVSYRPDRQSALQGKGL